jgi:hypothetical protein
MSSDYSRQLYKEYGQAILRIEELEHENRQLRHRAAELKNTLRDRFEDYLSFIGNTTSVPTYGGEINLEWVERNTKLSTPPTIPPELP